MNLGALWLVLLNYIAIGALPTVFFRRDDGLNLMWWITAWPFFFNPLLLVAGYFGFVEARFEVPPPLGSVKTLLVTTLSACSLTLIGFTVGTHRTPVSLWHQKDDAPVIIVQHGAYRWVRHPFYTAFLIVFIATWVLLPAPWTSVTLIYGFLILNFTAAGEEKRLSKSEFGDEYAAYMKRTGRFWPRLGTASS